MTDKVIYTFWEPRDRVIPYLALCMRTWEKNLPGYSVVVLNYSNLDRYWDRAEYDLARLKQLRLPSQKNAISIAVIQKHGGVFMDIDTLVFGDLNPILRRLENTQLVMFGSHMAFLAAQPNSHLLTLMAARNQAKMKALVNEEAWANVPWDYFGNGTLTEATDEIINRSRLNRLQTQAIDRVDRFVSRPAGWAGGLARPARWLGHGFLRRRKEFEFDTIYRKYLTRLDRKKYNYILEARAYEGQHLEPEKEYLNYWFQSDLDVNAVRGLNPILVGSRLASQQSPAAGSKVRRGSKVTVQFGGTPAHAGNVR